MTNEEAIEILKYQRGYFCDFKGCQEQQAYAMAIKALEQTELNPSYNGVKSELKPCEDCISRAEAIKIFGEVHPLDYNKQSYIARIQNLPSVTPQQTRWIPCSERLPERDENVLTYHRNESFDYQYISWIDDYSGKWAGFIGNLSDEVLAWRPLPEGYKEDKG